MEASGGVKERSSVIVVGSRGDLRNGTADTLENAAAAFVHSCVTQWWGCVGI